MQFDTDSGHKNFVEDVFDNELRVPGGSFGASPTQWTDMVGHLSQRVFVHSKGCEFDHWPDDVMCP